MESGEKILFCRIYINIIKDWDCQTICNKDDGSLGPILVITIKNNGNNGRNNYCRYVEDLTEYKGEDEVLITAFCIFKITKIDGNIYYLDCEGY